jgi:hypothetical protein
VDAEGTQMYIVIDDIDHSLHNSSYGSQVNLGGCVPLNKAMQGHPQADK